MPWPDDGFRRQVRGYRRDQVDEVVPVLEARVAAHDRAIAQLRGEPPPPPPPPTAAAGGAGARAHPGRASRQPRATAAERPLPWRRSDLFAPAAYLVVAGGCSRA